MNYYVLVNSYRGLTVWVTYTRMVIFLLELEVFRLEYKIGIYGMKWITITFSKLCWSEKPFESKLWYLLSWKIYSYMLYYTIYSVRRKNYYCLYVEILIYIPYEDYLPAIWAQKQYSISNSSFECAEYSSFLDEKVLG